MPPSGRLMSLAKSRKREISIGASESDDGTQPPNLGSHREETTSKKNKHRRCDAATKAAPAPQTLIVHKVNCDQTKHHQDHPSTHNYLNVPRLFEGDSKASPLRGTAPIDVIDKLLEENDDVSIVLYKIYSCNDYHNAIEEDFDPLPHPKHPDVSSLISYFFRLREHGKEATSIEEEIMLVSDDLKNALHKLTGMELKSLDRLDQQHMKTL